MKNLFDIKDKVIIVTGGCGILGKSIANYLAEQGAKIVILDRVEEIGKELEAELSQKTEAMFLVTDVLNKEILEKTKSDPETFRHHRYITECRRWEYAWCYYRPG